MKAVLEIEIPDDEIEEAADAVDAKVDVPGFPDWLEARAFDAIANYLVNLEAGTSRKIGRVKVTARVGD